MSGGRRLYVYYRVAPDALALVLEAVQAAQRELCRRHPGLEAELLMRPPLDDQLPTLMETYAAPDGVDAALQAEIELAMAQVADGAPRHVEVFVPAPTAS